MTTVHMQTKGKLRALRFAATFSLAIAAPASGELAPSAYIAMAAEAPEALRIEVLEVAENWGLLGSRYEVLARVQEIRHSASGLQIGDRLTIRYGTSRRPPGWVGPAQLGALREKSVVPAFLERDPAGGAHYLPAARGHSFAPWLWRDSQAGDPLETPPDGGHQIH